MTQQWTSIEGPPPSAAELADEHRRMDEEMQHIAFVEGLHNYLDEHPKCTPAEIREWVDGMEEAMKVREHFTAPDSAAKEPPLETLPEIDRLMADLWLKGVGARRLRQVAELHLAIRNFASAIEKTMLAALELYMASIND